MNPFVTQLKCNSQLNDNDVYGTFAVEKLLKTRCGNLGIARNRRIHMKIAF